MQGYQEEAINMQCGGFISVVLILDWGLNLLNMLKRQVGSATLRLEFAFNIYLQLNSASENEAFQMSQVQNSGKKHILFYITQQILDKSRFK